MQDQPRPGKQVIKGLANGVLPFQCRSEAAPYNCRVKGDDHIRLTADCQQGTGKWLRSQVKGESCLAGLAGLRKHWQWRSCKSSREPNGNCATACEQHVVLPLVPETRRRKTSHM